MLCQILIVAFTLLLSCVAPWRLGMLVSCLVASRTSSNAADEANLTPEALLVRRMPYYEAQFTALLFVTEQVLKDWLVIPIFALLLLSVVHIPLAVRLLFLKFTSVDPAK